MQNIAVERLALERGQYDARTPSIHWYVKPVETTKSKSTNKRLASAKRKQESLTKLAQDQRKIHDRIALKMIDFPQVAAEGFKALLGSTEATGKPIGDDIVQLALKAVYPPKRSGPSYYSFYPSSSYYYSSNDEQGEKVTLRTPVEFLSRHYGLGKSDQSEQIQQIATKLESLKAKEDAATFVRPLQSNTRNIC